MKRSVKEKWTTALRSGKYKQAMGKLKGGAINSPLQTGHCCLGVILDVVDPDGWTRNNDGTIAHRKASRSFRTGGYNQYINPSTAHALGIPAGQQKVLGKMNDMGSDFEQIAQYIEDCIPTEEG